MRRVEEEDAVTDIVDRLRRPPFGTETLERNLMASAADEIVLLRAALEPFRELNNEGNDDQPDDTPVTVHAGRSVCYWLTLADIRRVTAALERDKP